MGFLRAGDQLLIDLCGDSGYGADEVVRSYAVLSEWDPNFHDGAWVVGGNVNVDCAIEVPLPEGADVIELRFRADRTWADDPFLPNSSAWVDAGERICVGTVLHEACRFDARADIG